MRKRKVKYSSVNSYFFSDSDIRILIIKRPKQRYRAIINYYYNHVKN